MYRQISWRWLLLALPVIYLVYSAFDMIGAIREADDQCMMPEHYYYDQTRGWVKMDEPPRDDAKGAKGAAFKHPPPPKLDQLRVTTTVTQHSTVATTILQTTTVTATAANSVSTFVSPAYAHFPPPEADSVDRSSDMIDTFAGYKGAADCGISSLDLHLPFSPRCKTRDEVLLAMSTGGRAGYDEPFIPHGCDMSWYSTAQTCSILNRFSQIFILGDSLQRHLANALYIVLRGDIEYGGITDWDTENVLSGTENEPWGPKSKEECKCHPQFSRRACSEAVIRNSDYLWGNDSQSVKCSKADLATNIQYHKLLQWPLPDAEMAHLTAQFPAEKPKKPVAVIVHSSMWNNVNTTESTWYIEQIRDRIQKDVSWLSGPSAYFPKLFVTANAGGLTKALGLIVSQGNQALGNFEKFMENSSKEKGYEFLGMYNMSIQSTQPDGTHASMEVNMVKLMMVLNWLDRLDVEKF